VVTQQAVNTYIFLARENGWTLEAPGSLEIGWTLKYHGKLRDYDVYLEVNDEWIYMVCPLVQARIGSLQRDALYRYLLLANERIYMAKFALVQADGRGSGESVSLVCELPSDGFGSESFQLMSMAVAQYVEEYDREIQAVAFDPGVASLIR
jgi:hypothetical protein